MLNNFYPFCTFFNSLYNSNFVISDGDGVVEECYLLGVPTLVWRYEHLDSNHLFVEDTSLLLSKFDHNVCLDFYDNYKSYKKERKTGANSPSEEALMKLINL